jgi:hypothetical protein
MTKANRDQLMTGGKKMRLSRLAIATVTIAGAAAVGVALWKRAGNSTTKPTAKGTDEYDRFWTREHQDEAQPATLIDH